MTIVRVLRIFTDAAGESGNQLGVVRDASAINHAPRRAIACELGYSETVFVEDETRLQICCAIEARPLGGYLVELGGRVADDGDRDAQ